jgi:protein SCO1/2
MLNETNRRMGSILTVILLCWPLGCRKTDAGDSIPRSEHSSTVTRYHLRGIALGKSDLTKEITVKHEAIPGFMPAMTMAYRVKDPTVIHKVERGDLIGADVLVRSDNSDYLLDNVAITAGSKGHLLPTSLPPHRLLPGEAIPNIPLVNQDRRTIHLQDFRGKALLITFIYTRCPMPTACPRISSHFAQVNDALSRDPKAYAGSHLISISLDPDYDRPAVMRNYGLAYLNDKAEDFSHWEFATTSPTDLKRLAEAFGLEYTVEGGQITHTMQTILVGPNGKVIQTWPGSDWNGNDVAAAVTRSASVGH